MAHQNYRTIILGAGAAGLQAAAFAVKAGTTLVIDHAANPGEKIRISGGGRCNFTNLNTSADNFISQNTHFAKSALARYSQWDFLDLIARHSIPYHEKTLGQLFCDGSAKEIIKMLMDEMQPAELRLQVSVTELRKVDAGFALTASDGSQLSCENLVIATGGKSIPKMGASGFGYQVADQFDHAVSETRPALVPLTFGQDDMEMIAPLSGLSLDARVTCNATSFEEALLFTHRGLSGPAILQISSYWRETDAIQIDLAPGQNPFELLRSKRGENGRRAISNVIGDIVPTRLATALSENWQLTGNIADFSDIALHDIASMLAHLHIQPTGTEGYRTAEVTLGGVETDALNGRTMESKTVPGLYFIGEVVDVTGWLGGYNFQWAWSSGWAAGTAIAQKHSPN